MGILRVILTLILSLLNKQSAMKAFLIFIALLLACSGCASNSGTGGQVVSGILMGIGQGLSGL